MPPPAEFTASPPVPSVDELRAALARSPGSRELRLGLFSRLLHDSQFAEAVSVGKRLLGQGAADPRLQHMMAWARLGVGDAKNALLAIRGHPREAASCAELGAAAGELLGRWEDAERMIRRALAIEPGNLWAASLLVLALGEQHRFDEALARAREAELRFAKDPDQAGIFRFHQATTHLLQGRYEPGFALYEARLDMRRKGNPGTPLGLPVWQGEPLAGQTLLVRWEEGHGDNLMCARFAQRLEAAGAEVLWESLAPTSGVLGTCPGISRLVREGDAVPSHVLQVPVMSLLQRLVRDDRDISMGEPYLRVPPEVPTRERLDALLASAGPLPRIGLVWAGNPRHERDRQRSIPAALFERLGGVRGVTWVALQREAIARPSLPLVDIGPHLADFSDLAYSLSQLDGLITVDTAAAHLAGAMGRPCWVLVEHLPDWRWGLRRRDTPWYPSVEIWRQPASHDWVPVLDEIAARLQSRGFTVVP